MLSSIHELLTKEANLRDNLEELSSERPDPLMIAKKYNDEYISLVCALFAYGNAKLIVKFLDSLDFEFLDSDEIVADHLYYRFQSTQDIREFFKTMKLLKSSTSIEKKFYEGYRGNRDIMEGLGSIISYMYALNPYRSRGYEFLIGKIPTKKSKSTYKRWLMYLRWMVRSDCLDMGLWSCVEKRDLLAPLDAHTFKVGRRLGLIKRKSYDFKAVLELTQSFRKIDKEDPIKFDFALYRLGQEGLVQIMRPVS